MKRVILFQSFCSFGRASLTNQIPVLSALGAQPCPVPTAVLSTHLGYPQPAVTDLTDQCAATTAHWSALELTFQGVLSGFLSQPRQAALVSAAAERLLAADGLLAVDPVLGDHGHLYRSVSPALVEAQRILCRQARLLLPNLTEAAILLGREGAARPASRQEAKDWLRTLGNGRRQVVLTGWEEDGGLGALCLDLDGQVRSVLAPKIPAAVHGVGDLFSAVVLGRLLQEAPLSVAAEDACRFCSQAVAAFVKSGGPEPEGVPLESLLPELIRFRL